MRAGAVLCACACAAGGAAALLAAGVLRLPLKPGTASGYVSVQSAASRRSGPGKREATLTVAGRGRLLRSTWAALRSHWMPRLPGHRKRLQMATRSPARGSRLRASRVELRRAPTECLSLPQHCSHCTARLTLCSAVKRSTAAFFTPVTQHGTNEMLSVSANSANAPLSAATALDASAA